MVPWPRRMNVRRLARLIAMLVALCVVPTNARAGIDSPLVRAGLAAYDALDFPRAVSLLESARKERLTVEELTVTLRTLGSARVALGDDAGALAAFGRLLEVAPSYTLDRTVSPRIRAVFEEAQKNAPPRAPEAPPVVTPPPPAVVLTTPPPPALPPQKKPVYKRAWFWGVIGGVAGAAILGGVLGGVLTRNGTVTIVPQR